MRNWGLSVLPMFAIVLGCSAVARGQDPVFELQFSRPSRINAVKAWGDRVCAIDFDDFRLRCFDRSGRQMFDVDIRDRIRGGFNRMARIVDYTMLDDGGAAVLGFVVDPEARGAGEDFFPYVLELDSEGGANQFFPLRGGAPHAKALGGSRADNLVVLGLSGDFGLPSSLAAVQSSQVRRRPDGSLLHPLSPTGEFLAGRFSLEAPKSIDEVDRLESAMSKGVAVDGQGNTFFWLSDDTIALATPSGEPRSIRLNSQPGLFHMALRLIPRRDSGALALVLEGKNLAEADSEAAGLFALSAPELRVYALDSTGTAREIPSRGVADVAGELEDGTLVGLKGVGRGRLGVVLLGPIS